MPEEPLATKEELRRHCKQIRAALPARHQQRFSLAICAHLEALPAFTLAAAILAYLPMRFEVDLRPLIDRHPEKRWGLPRIQPVGKMAFHLYDPARLLPHPYGMLEPHPDQPIIHPAEAALALVPGLAFDRLGGRLGYGGGYYDRFLALFPGIAIGITYHALLLEQLPRHPHDIPLPLIVTELGLLTPGH